MYDIKAKLGFAFVVSVVIFGLILVGHGDALKNPDSLVGAWLLDGDTNDASGNDHHGELSGGAEWISGKHGMAVDFPGLGDTVQITGFGNIIPSEEITILGWARIDELVNQDYFSLEPLEVGNRGRVTSHMPWDNAVHWQFGSPFTGIAPAGIDDSIVGSWEHWAFTHSVAENRMAIFRNGEEASSGDTSAAFENGEANFHIGGRLGNSFAGAVDEFAIFNAVLGADEISALMNDGIMAHIGGATAVDRSGKAATTWGHLKALK